MTIDEFRTCLVSYYQGEVRGEAFFGALLDKFEDPESIQSFTERELAGAGADSIDEVVAQLRFPLHRVLGT